MTTLATRGTTRAVRGAAAEAQAALYLESQGLAVIARNLRCKLGEIDLVARDGATLAIVEVRCRTGERFGGALASVTWHKQRKVTRAARYFLQRRAAWSGLALRFDVVALQGHEDGVQRIVWVKHAFTAT